MFTVLKTLSYAKHFTGIYWQIAWTFMIINVLCQFTSATSEPWWYLKLILLTFGFVVYLSQAIHHNQNPTSNNFMVALLSHYNCCVCLLFVQICVVLLREIGIITRLVMSLQPLPFKETNSKVMVDIWYFLYTYYL